MAFDVHNPLHQYRVHGHAIDTTWFKLISLVSLSNLSLSLFEPSQLTFFISLFPLLKSNCTRSSPKIFRTRQSYNNLLIMSRRNGSRPKLDLKLNLSPPRANPLVMESPRRSATVSPTSPPSSCVSSEPDQDSLMRYSNSPEATSMVLVGCPRCLMYVMLSEDDPKCPKCKSTVLLDFLHDNNNNTTSTMKSRKS